MTRQAVAQQDTARAAAGAGLIKSAAQPQARFGTVNARISAEQAASNAQAGAWKDASECGVALSGAAGKLPRIAAALIVSADRGAYVRFNEVALAHIRDIRLETVIGSGSFVHQEKPAETAAILNTFLNA